MQTWPIAERLSQYYREDLELLCDRVSSPGGSRLTLDEKKLSETGLVAKHVKKYDYVFIPDALGYVYDIGRTFKNIRSLCKPETRLVFNYQNSAWQPLLDMAERLGLKSRRQRVNWLERQDIENLLYLAGYEVINNGRRFLWPIPMGGISEFINRYIANLPLINRLCLTNYVIARPEARPRAGSLPASIIIPARSEAGNIEEAAKAFGKASPRPELIFVEGHSLDNTWEEILRVKKKYTGIQIRAVRQNGIGKADAVRKGMRLAKNELLIIWDADLTVDPADFGKFYDAIVSGKGEFVFGSRLVYPLQTDSMRILNMLGNNFFSWIFSWLLGQHIKDTLCGTKVVSKENYRKIVKSRKYFGEFDPFGDFDLLFGAARLNLKFAEIPIRYRARSYGRTNISRFAHGWLLAKMVFFAMNKIKFVR